MLVITSDKKQANHHTMLTTTPPQIDINEKFKELATVYQATQENLLRLGQIVVELVEAKNSFEFIEDKSGIPYNVLISLERVGRKQLLPCLVMAPWAAANQARGLPYTQQLEYIENKKTIDVVVETATGSYDTRQVELQNLQGSEIKQVFSKGPSGSTIRTVPQQRSWLDGEKTKAKKEKEKEAAPADGWVVKDGKMHHKGTVFTPQMLLQILTQCGVKR